MHFTELLSIGLEVLLGALYMYLQKGLSRNTEITQYSLGEMKNFKADLTSTANQNHSCVHSLKEMVGDMQMQISSLQKAVNRLGNK